MHWYYACVIVTYTKPQREVGQIMQGSPKAYFSRGGRCYHVCSHIRNCSVVSSVKSTWPMSTVALDRRRQRYGVCEERARRAGQCTMKHMLGEHFLIPTSLDCALPSVKVILYFAACAGLACSVATNCHRVPYRSSPPVPVNTDHCSLIGRGSTLFFYACLFYTERKFQVLCTS